MTPPSNIQGPQSQAHMGLAQVALVEDNPTDRHWMRAVLRGMPEVCVRLFSSGEELLQSLAHGDVPQVVLADYRIQGLNGIELCRVLQDRFGSAPLAWGLVTGGLDDETDLLARGAGASDVFAKPLRADDFRRRVRSMLRQSTLQRRRTLADGRDAADIVEAALEILDRIAQLRDGTTGLHIRRMARYCLEIARAMGLSPSFQDLLVRAAPLHDLGKLGVPDVVLLKNGSLDDDEWALMRRHTAMGEALLRGTGLAVLDMAADIALHHHERFDGSGYPSGCRGLQIPLSARIVAVGDVFDALTTERPYKAAWPLERTLAHMRAQVGQHFDPEVFDAFERALPRLLEIRTHFERVPLSAGATPAPALQRAPASLPTAPS